MSSYDADAVGDNRVCLYRMTKGKVSLYEGKVTFAAVCTTS